MLGVLDSLSTEHRAGSNQGELFTNEELQATNLEVNLKPTSFFDLQKYT